MHANFALYFATPVKLIGIQQLISENKHKKHLEIAENLHHTVKNLNTALVSQ